MRQPATIFGKPPAPPRVKLLAFVAVLLGVLAVSLHGTGGSASADEPSLGTEGTFGGYLFTNSREFQLGMFGLKPGSAFWGSYQGDQVFWTPANVVMEQLAGPDGSTVVTSQVLPGQPLNQHRLLTYHFPDSATTGEIFPYLTVGRPNQLLENRPQPTWRLDTGGHPTLRPRVLLAGYTRPVVQRGLTTSLKALVHLPAGSPLTTSVEVHYHGQSVTNSFPLLPLDIPAQLVLESYEGSAGDILAVYSATIPTRALRNNQRYLFELVARNEYGGSFRWPYLLFPSETP